MLDLESINLLKKKAKKPWPLRGIEQKIYAANILLVASGIAQSIALKDWQYFERSGSLVIVLGIVIAWKDFSDHIKWFESMAKDCINRELSAIRNEKVTGLISYAIKSAKEDRVNLLSNSIDDLFERLQKRLRVIEVFTLAIGTIIWGYGSVLGNIIFQFNA